MINFVEYESLAAERGWTITFELPPSGNGLYHARRADGVTLRPSRDREVILLAIGAYESDTDRDEPRRCDCESGLCKQFHKVGGCPNPGTVQTVYGADCPACASYLPAEYLVPQRTN